MARAKFTPTDKQRMQVEVATACGYSQAHICRQIINPETGKPIDEKTLRQAFRTEINTGADTANAMVTQSLFKQATGKGAGAVSAAKYWLSCRAGWRETKDVKLQLDGNLNVATIERVIIDPADSDS